MRDRRSAIREFLTVTCFDIANNFNPLILALSAIFFGLGTENDSFFYCIVAITALCISMIIAIWNTCYQKTRKKLETQLNDANDKLAGVASNMPHLFGGLLVNLWKRIAPEAGLEVRVSIYVGQVRPNDGVDHFICCGRYSRNPEHSKPGRTKYPANQGYIWKGWETGWHFDDGFPDPDNDEVYATYNFDNYKILKRTLKKIRFKPRCCAVKRLDDNDSKPHGVIVVESKNSFNEEDLKEALEQLAPDYTLVLKLFREYIATLEDAREKEL